MCCIVVKKAQLNIQITKKFSHYYPPPIQNSGCWICKFMLTCNDLQMKMHIYLVMMEYMLVLCPTYHSILIWFWTLLVTRLDNLYVLSANKARQSVYILILHLFKRKTNVNFLVKLCGACHPTMVLVNVPRMMFTVLIGFNALGKIRANEERTVSLTLGKRGVYASASTEPNNWW